MTLMPVVLLMNVRMSRRLVAVKRIIERRARRRIQDRRRARLTSLVAELYDRRLRARRLDAIADHTFQHHDPVDGLGVARIELHGLPILLKRRVELVFRFELSCGVEVHSRGVQHRPLERDAEFGAARAGLHRLPVIGDGRVPVADACPLFASLERPAGRAAGEKRKSEQKREGSVKSFH